MNKICLNVLVGIPGAGKTTFCEHLQSHLIEKQSHVRSVHVCFDNFIKIDERFDLENGSFKISRKLILQCLDQFITAIKINNTLKQNEANETLRAHFGTTFPIDLKGTSPKTVYLILLDDNMYYRSMRYEMFKLARKHCTGYMQTYLDISLEDAISRNYVRSVPISEDIIKRMWIKMEKPSPQFYKWEMNSLTINSSTIEFSVLEKRIVECSENPEGLQLDVPKQPAVQSVIHKTDLLLRKAVGETIRSNTGRLSRCNLKILTEELVVRRKIILDDLRAGVIHIDPDIVTTSEIRLLF